MNATYDIGHVLRDGRNAFQIKRILGVGGMGEVYLVADKALGTDCVMKTLRPSAMPHKVRFANEAKVLARLRHRNVANVRARGETDEGVPYYLMDYLDGVSLRRLLSRRGALRIDAALNLGIQLFRGLQACHDREVVHRDIKPDNLLLAREDGVEVLKILDFGIMKLMSDLTEEGMICTAQYASPEQLVPSITQVTPSMDVYSAGAVLFEILTGKHPFSIYGLDEIGALERRDRIPVPLSTYGGHFPPAVEQIVAATMVLDPSKRPSAGDVATSLAPIARVLPAAYDTGRMVTSEDFLDRQNEPQAITRAELEAPTDPDGAQPAWVRLIRMHEEVAKTLGLDPVAYAKEKLPGIYETAREAKAAASEQEKGASPGAPIPNSLHVKPTRTIPPGEEAPPPTPLVAGAESLPVGLANTAPAPIRDSRPSQQPSPGTPSMNRLKATVLGLGEREREVIAAVAQREQPAAPGPQRAPMPSQPVAIAPTPRPAAAHQVAQPAQAHGTPVPRAAQGSRPSRAAPSPVDNMLAGLQKRPLQSGMTKPLDQPYGTPWKDPAKPAKRASKTRGPLYAMVAAVIVMALVVVTLALLGAQR